MDEGRVKAKVKRQRYVKTFAELSNASWVLLQNTEEQREGCFYECMVTILMAAFKFEAYLNHIGNILLSNWSEMERSSHKQKLNVICSHLDIQTKRGERPFQTLVDLFKFRNDVAHGRTEFLDPREATEIGYVEELRRKEPRARWERQCTLEFARRAYEDTEAIIRLIHVISGRDEMDLCRDGHSYVISDHESISSEASWSEPPTH